MNPILITIFSILIGIIGYFLVQTMIKINKNETVANQNTTDIALVRQEHDLRHKYMTEDFKELKEVLKELVSEMKEFNRGIKS